MKDEKNGAAAVNGRGYGEFGGAARYWHPLLLVEGWGEGRDDHENDRGHGRSGSAATYWLPLLFGRGLG